MSTIKSLLALGAILQEDDMITVDPRAKSAAKGVALGVGGYLGGKWMNDQGLLDPLKKKLSSAAHAFTSDKAGTGTVANKAGEHVANASGHTTEDAKDKVIHGLSAQLQKNSSGLGLDISKAHGALSGALAHYNNS